MSTTVLLIAAVLGAQQSGPQPEHLGRGCGYTSGAAALAELEFGNFDSERRYPFADQYGRSVRVAGQWTHPDQTPWSDARGEAWAEAHPTITVGGRQYQRDGLPWVMALNESRWIAEVDGRAVTAEPHSGVPATVYVLTQPLGCTFQRYRLPEPKG